MQHGCMERLNRKRGPEVWQFRWSVTGPDGKRLYHKKIVGTVERYPDENAARRSVVGLVLQSMRATARIPRRFIAATISPNRFRLPRKSLRW